MITDHVELGLVAAGLVFVFTGWFGLVGWTEIGRFTTPRQARRSRLIRLGLIALLPTVTFLAVWRAPVFAWVVIVGSIALLLALLVGALLAL